MQANLLRINYDKPDKVKDIADIFAANLEKVAMHGKNLLSLSKPTKPRFELLDINSVLAETTDTLILTGVLKHYTIERSFCRDSSYINGDRNLLEQVIRNIEINAAHAMKPGGTLKVSTHHSGGYFDMAFADTGNGIPAELMEKIFQPFFTTKPEGQGTGLGLPIVKEIIEQHDGEIRMESQVGVGTTVSIRLPVAIIPRRG